MTEKIMHQGFHLMAKPAGPVCNLCCEYCFYREKQAFFPEGLPLFMSEEVLTAYVKEYIRCQPGPSVLFDWQGGEPCLRGIEFFRQAIALQNRFGMGKAISNTLQTNGTLIDEAWCRFLSKNNFLVGLSIDGPSSIHDRYRMDKNGNPTCDKVYQTFQLMRRHSVNVNVLATVNRESSRHPLEVYRFFKDMGVQYIQFIPVVERLAGPEAEKLGLPLCLPPSLTCEKNITAVTPWSVEPEAYGTFLIRIYEEWIKNDVGKIFVMNFEWSLGAWVGAGPGVCYMSPRCGTNLILEYNGDIYCCDHFMYPEYRLGNILDNGLDKILHSGKHTAFGALKETALPASCRGCDFLFVCRGACPKHRFTLSPQAEPGLNYLCPGLKNFYRHINASMNQMAEFIRRGINVQNIMTQAGRPPEN